jgi:hypothetical protein
MRWNRIRFENFLAEELETFVTLPAKNEDTVITVTEDKEIIKIYPIKESENPSFNSKTEMLHGPIWSFTDTHAISSYEVQKMPVESVKNFMKESLAAERYNRENHTVPVIINGTMYEFSTNKDTRNLIQNALIASQELFKWKINRDVWIDLTNDDLRNILDAIIGHVQSCFDWEYSVLQTIDNSNTHEELDGITIENLNKLSDLKQNGIK